LIPETILQKWTGMLAAWCKNLLIALILVMIVLPTEEDGVFASVFLPISKDAHHVASKKKAPTEEKLVEPEISGVDESATFVRNRCDFLDLVVDSNYNQSISNSFSFTKPHLGRDDIHHFLLSDFLLNLPPPVA
jgi:hypothetical protein